MHGMIAAALAAVLMAHGAASAQAPDPPAPQIPSIVTTGEAVVRRAPDQAFVVVAVESRARNPRDAQRQNAEAMTAVQQRVAAGGIAKDAMRTLGYNIQQEFDYVDGRRISRGYVARNAIEIRVDAVDRTGEILDMSVQAGATSVTSIRFDLKDRAAAEREALRLAVVDARARAEAAAAGVGRNVDRVLRIDDTPQARIMPVQRPMMAMAREAAADASQTPVEGGELEIRAQVVLTMSIK
jgi:uncharacterized protein YggE